MGIVAHYTTGNSRLEHRALALKDIDSEHDRSHLTVAVLKVIEDCELAPNMGYFVMDNAGNNDTMMKALSLGRLPIRLV